MQDDGVALDGVGKGVGPQVQAGAVPPLLVRISGGRRGVGGQGSQSCEEGDARQEVQDGEEGPRDKGQSINLLSMCPKGEIMQPVSAKGVQ